MGKRRVNVTGGVSGAAADSRRSLAAARAPVIRRLLLDAYDAGRRDLPWRGEADPYRIWVSEVMLQQTRVETVIPYYKEWVTRFPDVETLATADEEEVLRAWQGLGYYSRARNLLGAAKVVRERLGGKLPGSSAGLRTLPGVGEYTAGAVASIAYGEAVPAVDGNVRRVLSRLFDLQDPGSLELRDLAAALVDPARPGDFNQALMELGARVCTSRSPGCRECPIGSLCLARERGSVGERPGKRARRPLREIDLSVLVAATVGPESPRLLLRKRPPEGLLAGMWEFPGVGIGTGEDAGRAASAHARELGLELGGTTAKRVGNPEAEGARPAPEVTPETPTTPLPLVIHLFTHLKARYHPFLARVERETPPPSGGRWLSPKELDELPLPVAQGKILGAAMEVLEGLGCRAFRS
jgi:A/G-specific adenine glycosylase